jgi:hypothetical protein
MLDTHNRLQISPAVMMTDIFKSQWVSNRPTLSNFNTSVTFVDGFVISAVDACKVYLIRLSEPVLHILIQGSPGQLHLKKMARREKGFKLEGRGT